MSENKQIPAAVEGMFAVLLGQNALLFSKPIIDILQSGDLTFTHLFILIAASVSFFNVAANWVGSRAIGKQQLTYTTAQMFWDITILGVLFIHSQVIIDLISTSLDVPPKHIVYVSCGSFTILCILYMIWNLVTLNGEVKNATAGTIKPIINRANARNAINIFVSITLIVLVSLPLEKDLGFALLTFVATVWMMIWVYIIFVFINDNELMKINNRKSMDGSTE